MTSDRERQEVTLHDRAWRAEPDGLEPYQAPDGCAWLANNSRILRDAPPERAWLSPQAAKLFRKDLEGLTCVDCGAPAVWCEVGGGEILGLCQAHIGAHVP